MILDHRKADLAPADRALCDFAVKLTLSPGAMNEQDIATLRQRGFTDEAIHLAAQIIGYFNYINRVADALHVEDEKWFDMTREEWLAKKGRGYGEE